MAVRKPKLLTMKVDETEKSKWAELAKSHDMSLAELIRTRLNDLKLPEAKKRKPRKVPKADPELLRQIAGIGNNLNQISRRVNEGQKFDVALELSAIEAQLRRLLDAHQVH